MERTGPSLLLGLDVGSTTAKAVLVRQARGGTSAIVASAYRRHEARVSEAVLAIAAEVTASAGDEAISVLCTGSAGMGLAERAGLPFVQEVHAACALAALRYPAARTLLDIGGEDSKLVFLEEDGRLDARMNGGCAGGTGAFLDQMAALLSVGTGELEPLASAGTHPHPVASRCGVFAKTDVQNLLSLGVGKPDVALSVFHALATQVLAALARGRKPEAPVLVTGGPLTFLPSLREVFRQKLRLGEGELLVPEDGELACAHGAALTAADHGRAVTAPELTAALHAGAHAKGLSTGEPPLFGSAEERQRWMAHRFTRIPRVPPAEACGELFLGIDSGSTTTKMVLLDGQGRLVASDYQMNHGDPLEAARRGIDRLREALRGSPARTIRCAAATGYGEDLVKAALGIELGLVETAAHLRGAQAVAPDVSFVLDIGGQDMKALFVRQGRVERVEVNEACSSGCGSFIQTFAETLSLSVQGFAEAACHAGSPRGLGSRCTVFMNSMVKQALREGAGVEDIAAGLAYSVARNCLQKVLKLRDVTPLGDTIVVQGGTFLNPAVQRAFEVLTGKTVLCPDIAGLAGAYGAALWAKDHGATAGAGRLLDALAVPPIRKKHQVRCKACDNTCPITLVDFEGAGRHVSGNRCERAFRNRRGPSHRGTNHLAEEVKLLLDRPLKPEGRRPRQRIGLPLALGMYENLPFWASLLVGLGHEVVVSGTTDAPMVEAATDTICSENVCLPARITSAHLVRLGERGVDRIFFPCVVYEAKQPGALTGYNCPIVIGYPEAVSSAVPPERRGGAPVSTPAVSFRDEESLRRTARLALQKAGIEARGFSAAFKKAWADYQAFHQARRELGRRAVAQARQNGRRLVMLACRPYHLDPYLHHGVPEMLADLDYDVVSAQCLPDAALGLSHSKVLAQWAYPNRVLQAAGWVAEQQGVQLIQLNSFGCGPDAVVADEAMAILESKGKPFTLLRVDESTAPGSIRLRLRTMEMGAQAAAARGGFERRSTPPFQLTDRRRTLLTVPMDPLLFSAIGPEFVRFGYDVRVLPPSDRESLELGLKYVNNEVCYPAILTIGDVIKALGSGRYSLADTGVAWTQTGGPCRATNYIPLMKKALVAAGFGEVPVVTLQYGGDPLNEQPGFVYDRMELFKVGLATIAVTDSLSMMYRALAPREQHPGQAWATAERLVAEWLKVERRDAETTYAFVEHAVRQMAAVPVARQQVRRVGIVGEIYVKYSAYANRNLVDWLVSHQIEPVVPPLASFFVQEPVNAKANSAAGLDGRWLAPLVAGFVDHRITRFLEELNARLHRFPYPVHFPIPRQLAAKASRVLSITHQYGEGWVLGGEILDMADHGIREVVSLQPFGCIANQVIARGIERRLRVEHPDLNLLFLDLDHNVSEANLFNRLKLLISPPPRLARRPAAAPARVTA